MSWMKAAELHRLLTVGGCAKGTDATLPMITHVHVWADGEFMWAESTDRFMLIRARVAFSGPRFDVMVSPGDLKYLVAASKTGVREAKDRAVKVSATATGLRFEFDTQVVTATHGDYEFPKLGALLASAVGTEGLSGFPAFDARLLARLKPFGIVRLVSNGANRPMVFEVRHRHGVEPSAYGMVMPVRLDDGGAFSVEGWTGDVTREVAA